MSDLSQLALSYFYGISARRAVGTDRIVILSGAPHRFIACYRACERGVRRACPSAAEGTPAAFFKPMLLRELFGHRSPRTGIRGVPRSSNLIYSHHTQPFLPD